MHSNPSQNDTPPSTSSLHRALSHSLLDANADSTTLSNILSAYPASSRVLVLFIRNFLCGNCQQFLLTLTSLLPPQSLPSDLSIIVIGCGAPSLISSYIDITQCPYPIYTDPTNTLYNVLGMQRSLSLGPKAPEYIKQSLVLGAMKSIVQGIKRVNSGDMLSAGEMSVNGGEFLFARTTPQSVSVANANHGHLSGRREAGSSALPGMDETNGTRQDLEWTVPWCHRMQNTRDHTEIPALKVVLGMTPPSAHLPPRTPDPRSSESTDEIADEKAAMLRRSTTSKLQRTLCLSKRIQSLTRSHTMRNNTRGTEQRPKTRRWHSRNHTLSHGANVQIVTAS